MQRGRRGIFGGKRNNLRRPHTMVTNIEINKYPTD